MEKYICKGNKLAIFLKLQECNLIEEIKKNGSTQYIFEFNEDLKIAIEKYKLLRKKSLF